VNWGQVESESAYRSKRFNKPDEGVGTFAFDLTPIRATGNGDSQRRSLRETDAADSICGP